MPKKASKKVQQQSGLKDDQRKDPGYSSDILLEQGNQALSSMELELAKSFFSRALELAPSDTNIMDSLSDVCIQLGELDMAKSLLDESVKIAPNTNPYKWMVYGQLQSGFDAVSSYKKGIEALSLLLTAEEAVSRHQASKQIAKVYSAIAELYMTDLCFEADAESECEKAVTAALTAEPDSLDGLQSMASLRLSQNRKSDAAEIMDRVHERISHIRQVVAKRTVLDEMAGVPEPTEFQDIPEMEFCVASVKLLIECAGGAEGRDHNVFNTSTQLAKKAFDLASDLIEEDDENIELWYLAGVAALSCEPVDRESAALHLERAREMMEQLRQKDPSVICNGEFVYQEQLDLVNDHLQLLSQLENEQACSNLEMQQEPGKTDQSHAPMDEEWSDDEDKCAAERTADGSSAATTAAAAGKSGQGTRRSKKKGRG